MPVHHRNSRWFMGLVLYPATALIGTLPWSLGWRPRTPRRGDSNPWRWLRADAGRWFLTTWIVIPLVVLSLARSRLPFYLLPIFPALALAIGRAGLVPARPEAASWAGPDLPRPRSAAWLAGWVATLLGLRLLFAWYPAPQDTRALARWIRAHGHGGLTELVVVDERIYGLPFYLDMPVELMSRHRRAPAYRPTAEQWDEEISELGRARYRHLYLVRGHTLRALEQRIEDRSVVCERVPGPHAYHLLACEPPP
jgi:4-amino-4-deoxy-L-arabinose transferase